MRPMAAPCDAHLPETWRSGRRRPRVPQAYGARLAVSRMNAEAPVPFLSCIGDVAHFGLGMRHSALDNIIMAY